MWKYGIIVSAIIYTALPRGRKSIVGKAIAIFNQKGGVGKTTTTFSLGVALANNGKKVLVVDADPQANLTTCMGFYDEDNIPVTLETLYIKV